MQAAKWAQSAHVTSIVYSQPITLHQHVMCMAACPCTRRCGRVQESPLRAREGQQVPTYDEGCCSKQADVQELDAPVADPLHTSPPHQQVELAKRARYRPVAALLPAAARHPAPAQQPVHPCACVRQISFSTTHRRSGLPAAVSHPALSHSTKRVGSSSTTATLK